MKITITPGNGITNRKLLLVTNKYFNKTSPRKKKVIPLEKYGMVVSIQYLRVSFSIYDETKNYQNVIEQYLEFLFAGKSIGITMPISCQWDIKIPKVNIFQL